MPVSGRIWRQCPMENRAAQTLDQQGPFSVMAAYPEFEVLWHPAHENGVERQNPRNASDSWLFRVRDGGPGSVWRLRLEVDMPGTP